MKSVSCQESGSEFSLAENPCDTRRRENIADFHIFITRFVRLKTKKEKTNGEYIL